MSENEKAIENFKSTSSAGSVTQYLASARKGDQTAELELWERLFSRVVAYLRTRGHSRQLVVDEEDIASSVMKSLLIGLRQGRFRNFQDRSDLWRTLIQIARVKRCDALRYWAAEKRGFSRTLQEADHSSTDWNIDEVAAEAGVVEFAAIARDLIDALPSGMLKQIALAKLQGYKNVEIAAMLSVSNRTIDRKLEVIRSCWEGVS